MKNFILLLVLSLTVISCKKEDMKENCTEAFVNQEYDASYSYLISGTWHMVGHYPENCEESLVNYNDYLRITFSAADGFQERNLAGVVIGDISYTGDALVFNTPGMGATHPSDGIAYNIAVLTMDQLVLENDGYFIHYYK